jgi:hypothetical protein
MPQSPGGYYFGGSRKILLAVSQIFALLHSQGLSRPNAVTTFYAEARRGRPGTVVVPNARYHIEQRDPGVFKRQQGATTVRRHRRDKWNDPRRFPWTMGFAPSYRLEARIYGRYILKNMPDAKIAVLYQNDDLGKDYVTGLREGLGDKVDKMIVATKSYETTDPTVDSQIVALQGSGADTLLTAAIPKFAAQTIRKVYDTGWRPAHFLSNVSISVKAVLRTAGIEKSVGIISATYGKEVTDPKRRNSVAFRTSRRSC